MQDLRCNIPGHNKKKFVSLQLSNQADKRLFCFQCVNDIPMANSLTQSQISAQQLCDLEEVMDSTQYNVFNWPIDPVGRKVKEMLLQFKTPEQQKKEVEDFFLQMKTKITESVDQIKTLLIDTINVTLGVEVKLDPKLQQELGKDQKKDDKKDDKKEAKKDDKKEAKKDDKKEAKKDDKKDDKKDNKKDEKKEAKKEDKKDDKKEELDAPTIQNLKKLYDQVYDLTRIRQLIKDNAKNADPDVLSQKIGDALNDVKRNEQFGFMKEMFTKLSSNPKKAEINTGGEQIQGFQQRVLESLTSWSQFFGVVSWKFQISQAEESNKIKTITQGIELQGGGSQQQIIYSSETFSAGQHGCLFLFEEFDPRRSVQNGNFIIGLVPEDKKDAKGYGHGFRKCLFTGTGEGLIAKNVPDFSNVLKATPKLISIKVNVENDQFEITDGKRQVTYELDKQQLRKQSWRIYIQWREAADRIKLIHSY